MGRPAKIPDPTKTYSLLLSVEMYERLADHAARLQKKSLEQVSVGDLMRDSIELYLEALDEECTPDVSKD
jgi:predicted DNA-binding protein